MAILSYNYQQVFINLLFSSLKQEFFNNSLELNSIPDVFNFVKTVAFFDKNINDFARLALKTFLEKLNQEFSDSVARKKSYHVSSHPTRTIMTIFGLVTYTRTYYVNIVTKKAYCHVDRFMGLKRYDHYDPYIKSLIIENAATNSFAVAGKNVTSMIGNRVHLEKRFFCISRQTVRNCILKNKIAHVAHTPKPTTPTTLFVMLDEKFIATQNNKNRDIMVKQAVIHAGIREVKNHRHRHELIDKHTITTFQTGLSSDVLDYIHDTYDIGELKKIVVLGDGAGWIKNVATSLKLENIEVIFSLDKYHFKQALRLITLDNSESNSLLEYIMNNDKMSFNHICHEMTLQSPHREEVIQEKQSYILNNWYAIQIAYHHNLKCCMEGQISHNLASLFSSRPKGYSKRILTALIHLRTQYSNHHNLKILFLKNFDKQRTITLNKHYCNFSVFDFMNEKGRANIGRDDILELYRKRYY